MASKALYALLMWRERQRMAAAREAAHATMAEAEPLAVPETETFPVAVKRGPGRPRKLPLPVA